MFGSDPAKLACGRSDAKPEFAIRVVSSVGFSKDGDGLGFDQFGLVEKLFVLHRVGTDPSRDSIDGDFCNFTTGQQVDRVSRNPIVATFGRADAGPTVGRLDVDFDRCATVQPTGWVVFFAGSAVDGSVGRVNEAMRGGCGMFGYRV